MKLAVNQPYFLPYIGYFQLIASADVFVFYGGFRYVRKTWINRNRFYFYKKQQPDIITLPVSSDQNSFKILDMKMSTNIDIWRRKKITQLKSGYAKATYFDEVFPLFEDILLSSDYTNLATFNADSAIKICNALKIKTKLISCDDDFEQLELRALDQFTEANSIERKLYRIFELCKMFEATTYHNLPGGAELYDKTVFAEQGIDLKFIKIPEIIYPQFTNDFVPHLSIIDVLMHNGIEKTSELVHGYQLT